MSARPRTLACALIGAVCLPLTLAPPATAHGIGDDALGRSVPDFVPIGIEHMLLGWDHLLFIVAVVVLAQAPRRAVKFVSLFAAGHSLTLLLATVAQWRVDPEFVDVIIALSIAFVGVVGVRGEPYNWRWFGAGVFGFGLVHGLGLSTRFQDLGLPEDGRIPRLIAFNIGIEIGQLLAIALVVLTGLLLLDIAGRRRFARRPEVLRAVNGVVLVVGLVAAGVLGLAARGGDAYAELAADGPGNCTVQKAQAPLVLQGGHPARNFFAPGESYADQDFGHVVGDNYLVIRYRAELPAADRDAIRTFVASSQGVVAGPVAGQDVAVLLTTQPRVLSCATFDLATLRQFAGLWFAERTG